jgi:site-specific DNA recombinase
MAIVPNDTPSRQASPLTHTTTLAAIYARVSTQDQADKGFSLPTQIEACHQLAQAHGYAVPEDHIFVDDYTGTSLNRPQFTRLRDLVRQRLIQAIVVHDLDRLSRKLAHQLLLSEEFEQAAVALHIVTMPEGARTPETQLLTNVRGIIAEYERAKILERMERGRVGRAKAGYPPASRVSMGYRYIKHEKKGGHYEIDPEGAAIVRQLFELYVHGGYSLNQLARLLTERGVLHPQRRPDSTVSSWDPGTIHWIIKNETYIGRFYYGKKQGLPGIKNPDKKTRWRRVPKEEQILIEVPAIIDQALFDAAQEKLVRNAATSRRNRKYEYLLIGGRLKCGQCGRSMTGYSNGQGARLYKCTRRSYQETDPHSKRRVTASAVEPVIWQAVERVLNDPLLIAAELERRRDGTSAQQDALDSERQQYTRHFAQCDKDIKRWEAAYLGEAIDLDDFKAKKAEIDARRASVAEELARLDAQQQRIVETTLETVAIEEYCARVRQDLQDFTLHEQRRALDALNVQAVWRPGYPLEIQGSIPVVIASNGPKHIICNITFLLAV